jgi:hypothetical protein
MRTVTSWTVSLLLMLTPGIAAAHTGGHAMGTISAFDRDHIELTTQDGKTISVKLAPDTKYYRGDEPASAADLVVGLRCMIHLSADKSAAEVHLPAAPKPGT